MRRGLKFASLAWRSPLDSQSFTEDPDEEGTEIHVIQNQSRVESVRASQRTPMRRGLKILLEHRDRMYWWTFYTFVLS
jgi:hypothetical protein